MLVLSRRKGERILIGNNVEVVIVEVRGNQVRLGITAPDDVSIQRKELATQACDSKGRVHSGRITNVCV